MFCDRLVKSVESRALAGKGGGRMSSSEVESVVSTELRLLLSDRERVSGKFLILAVGVAMLAGRESRRSFSISERRGRLGVSSSVRT